MSTTNNNNAGTGFGELVLILGDMFISDRSIQIPLEFAKMLLPGRMQYVLCTGNMGTMTIDELKILAPNVSIVNGDYDNIDNNENAYNIYPEQCVVQIGSWKIGMIHGHQIIPSTCAESYARQQRSLSNVDILITGHTHQSNITIHHNYIHINPGSITGAYKTTSSLSLSSYPGLLVSKTIITTPSPTITTMTTTPSTETTTPSTTEESVTDNNDDVKKVNDNDTTTDEKKVNDNTTEATTPTTANGSIPAIIPSFILLAMNGDNVTCYVYKLINHVVDVTKTEFTKQDISTSSSITNPMFHTDPTLLNNLLK